MSEWKECKLGEIINIKHGYAFKGEFFSDVETENILITPGNFKIGGGFKSDKFKYYNGEVSEEYILKTDDVIVTMTDLSKDADTLGYSAVVPKISGKRFLHNQRLGLVKCKSVCADIMFICWLLRTEDYRWYIIGAASGSTVSHTSPTRILEYKFLLPPLPEQKAIAGVLSSLDDKIDLLARQNKTLEGMAEALWRKMFVEEADPNWQKGKLGDMIDLNYGKGLSENNRMNGQFPVIGSSGIIGSHSEYLVIGPGIVIGRKGTLGKVNYIFENFYPIDTTYYVISKINSKKLYYEYFLLKEVDFSEMNTDSAVPGLNRNIALSQELNIPSEEYIQKFNEYCDIFFMKLRKNNIQIRTISRLRDTLLPKLMSGEVRVRL